jgi:hypothetical protein
VGQVFAIPKHLSEELERESANLTLEAVSLYSRGNETVFYISLKNVGNEPVTVYAISVQTLWNASLRSVFGFLLNKSQNYFSVKWSVHKSFNVSFPVLFFVNGTELVAFPSPRQVIPIVSNIVSSNMSYESGLSSYVIYPGQRVTFEYEGVLVLVHGKHISIVLTAPHNVVFSFRVLSMPPYFANYSFTTG